MATININAKMVLSKMMEGLNPITCLNQALCYYKRNIWMTGLAFIFLLFNCYLVFFGGIRGILQSGGFLTALIGLIVLFRFGCKNRDLFDLEDMISCFFHVTCYDLHYYMADTEFYEISTKRQGMNFLFRVVMFAVCLGSFYLLVTTLDNMHFSKFETYPLMTLAFAVSAVIINVFFTAFLERRYRTIYRIPQSADE